MDRANGVRPGAPPSRAERFEDEKRRIIDSCFARKDPDGSLQETYITHIRITEFSSHPAAPPPPPARTPDSMKPRVIIIAVRKSGRVRMHKSKENANGTFSVGKTWNIDDLTHIESFTGPQVGANNREWAGDTGFTVTLGKPYFWQAQTDKEKKFFIASMIKIFGKYTSGRTPELSGFDQKELDQVMGAGKRPAGNIPAVPANGPPPPRPGPPEFLHSQSNMSTMSSNSTPDVSARLPKASPVRTPASGKGSPAGSFDSSASRDRLGLRNASINNRSQDSLTYPANRSEDTSSLPPRSRNGMTGPGAFGRFGDPREISEPPSQPLPQPPTRASNQGPAGQPPRSTMEEQPPERRRPPMDPGRPQDRNLVPAPLMSPANKQEVISTPPPRSSERLSPRKTSAGQRAGVVPLGGALKDGDQPPPAVLTPGNAFPSRTQKFGEGPPPAALTPGTVQVSPRAPRERETPTPPALGPGSRPLDSSPATPPTIRKVSSAASLPKAESATPRSVATPPPPIPANMPSSPAPTQPLPATPPAPTPSETQTPEAPPPPPETPTDSKAEDEEARPGLGPMIKSKKSKGELANAFRKAASAANAFKPRPGGAGERLRLLQGKINEGPDGITSVVPAPPRPAEPEKPEPVPEPPPKAPDRTSNIPEVKITVPESGRPVSSHESVTAVADKLKDPAVAAKEAAAKEAATKEARRRSMRAGNDTKYLQSLGIDATVLDGRSDEFSKWLDFFGWVPGDQMRTKGIDDMKTELDRELNKAQAGGWLARFQEEDERVDAIKKGIDVAITECEELDNLLTLYSVELSTLSDDIAFIEAQGQGLQVQTANQKLLKKELESLLETCAITSNDLDILRIAPLDNLRGLEDVEISLVMLFKAMIKIDPSLGGAQDKVEGADTDRMNSDYSNMRIVQEKKEMYMQESSLFMRRLMECMVRQFDDSFAETKRALEGALSKKVDATHHEAGRDLLWKYSPLMLYARDVDLDNWNRIIQIYQDKAHPVYKNEFGTVITSWRRNARKMGGEEAELLFTHQVEKQQEGVATTARKLTVKRSQTLARALRSPLADGGQKHVEKASGDRSFPYEVFAGVLDDLLPLVEMEQNFVIDFFHATTLEQLDFPDAVGTARPRDRRGGDLKRHRLMEPDRDLARRITRSMEVIFSFFEQELTRLIEWVLAQYPLQGIGVLAILEKKMADMSQSNLDYLNALFQKLHSLLSGKFRKFVDEQIRAIEETKVKINKRKGVISFIRVFTGFSTAVENMVAGVDPTLAVRRTIDREYDRILKTMFDSLKVIARENPAVTISGAATADPEDKEALNFHILLIENMNHFVEETDARGLDILEEWKETADQEYHDHMGLYLNAVMRRPLGKLLDHLENIEAQLQMGKSPSAIAAQPSNSKTIFNKILGGYDSKEVRKGIEALRKRVEKHFGDADDPALSKELVAKVTKECEKFFSDVESRIGRVTTDVYGGDVLFEWPRADVKAAFR